MHESIRRPSRRTFLKAAGVSLALPALDRDARAGRPDAPPMRLVCVANPLGFIPDQFFPKDAGEGFTPSPLLRHLPGGSYTVFSHLDHGVPGGHQATHAFLSGVRDNQSAEFDSRNITLDQRAAEAVGPRTRFPSLVAGVGRSQGELACRTSWTRNGVNVPPVISEHALFEALFVTGSEKDRAARREAARRNASVLDAVREQAASLRPRLGKRDRQKLEEYFTSVRSVEKQLAMSAGWIDRPKPAVDLAVPEEPQDFTRRLPLFYELFALALQTDSTRVATLSIPGDLPVGDLGLSGSYHAFSHHGQTQALREGLSVIERFQMKALAGFLERLKSQTQPGGASLLDSTMVLAGSGLGNASSHSNKNLPVLLAGGGFRHGRHLVLPDGPRRVPLCNLFTSVLQRFGVEEERFNTATGTLTGLV